MNIKFHTHLIDYLIANIFAITILLLQSMAEKKPTKRYVYKGHFFLIFIYKYICIECIYDKKMENGKWYIFSKKVIFV